MAVKHNICETGFPFIIYRGTSLSLDFTHKNTDGTPIDLTSITVVIKIRLDETIYEYTTTANAHGSGITITDAPNGEFTLLITAAETTTFEVLTGVWWITFDDILGHTDTTTVLDL